MTDIALITHGALPAVRICAADGAQAIVTLYGAHLVSWTSAAGKEQLFLSERSALDGSRAIRGGVPVIFPQFAERGTGMRHGFARVSTWRQGESGSGDDGAFAVFMLTHADLAASHGAAWPHGFELRLKISVRAAQLVLSLDVRNAGDDAFAFSSALHTYFAVDTVDAVRVRGVQAGELAIGDKHDQIYRDIAGTIELQDGAGTRRLTQTGFRDAVVWNPGAADTAALADMDDSDYLHFTCVEAALIEPLTLQPGGAWRGEHRIVASA
ncbi:D-hexose-6-phosphate mutarotase [Massilia sp. CF038]|uniref:D-hexose-6-phosphate mutarotase n=1 Tax=Massilia sp. CF038 TaxID=1881045 RepID=UPI000916B55E|nr:D-hexose-6-phosphate mutarotase [Massilia sp. CF038]SHG38109.1 glucose-6-phosphate 1-epimerase [Massilia sp. CF038]